MTLCLVDAPSEILLTCSAPSTACRHLARQLVSERSRCLIHPLDVEPQQVVLVRAEAADWCFGF
jgi:hypothetical protein